MRKSDINFHVYLDDDKIPEMLQWSATDNGNNLSTAKAVNISIWDGTTRETLKMDLWTKDMPVDEMKMFYIDIIGSLSETLKHATGDEALSNILKKAGKDMLDEIQKSHK